MPTLQELTGAASVHADPQAPTVEMDPAPPIDVESEQELDVLPDIVGAAQETQEDVGDKSTGLRYKSMLLPANIKDMLKQYDVDDDGSVDIAELLNAVQAHSNVKQESRHQKRMILALAILFVFLGACLFGSMLAAIEISKETKTEGQKYMVPPGKDQIIATGAAKQEYSLFNLVVLPDHLIETIDKLTYTNEKGNTVMADIQERVRAKDGSTVTLETAKGDAIVVAKGSGTLVKADGTRFPICGKLKCARFSINDPTDEDMTTHTRRLQGGGCTSCEAGCQGPCKQGPTYDQDACDHYNENAADQHQCSEADYLTSTCVCMDGYVRSSEAPNNSPCHCKSNEHFATDGKSCICNEGFQRDSVWPGGVCSPRCPYPNEVRCGDGHTCAMSLELCQSPYPSPAGAQTQCPERETSNPDYEYSGGEPCRCKEGFERHGHSCQCKGAHEIINPSADSPDSCICEAGWKRADASGLWFLSECMQESEGAGESAAGHSPTPSPHHDGATAGHSPAPSPYHTNPQNGATGSCPSNKVSDDMGGCKCRDDLVQDPENVNNCIDCEIKSAYTKVPDGIGGCKCKDTFIQDTTNDDYCKWDPNSNDHHDPPLR